MADAAAGGFAVVTGFEVPPPPCSTLPPTPPMTAAPDGATLVFTSVAPLGAAVTTSFCGATIVLLAESSLPSMRRGRGLPSGATALNALGAGRVGGSNWKSKLLHNPFCFRQAAKQVSGEILVSASDRPANSLFKKIFEITLALTQSQLRVLVLLLNV